MFKVSSKEDTYTIVYGKVTSSICTSDSIHFCCLPPDERKDFQSLLNLLSRHGYTHDGVSMLNAKISEIIQFISEDDLYKLLFISSTFRLAKDELKRRKGWL